MEPDKFEKYIQSKLEGREITPSDDAWTRISTGLGANQSHKSNRPYFWYGVAASVIVLIGITMFYLNSGVEEVVPDEKIVETPTKVNPEVTNQDIPDAVVFEGADAQKIEQTNTEDYSPQENSDRNLFEETTRQNVAVNSNNEEIQDTSKIAIVPEDVLNSKIAEVMVQVDFLALSTEVTDAEVDSLLHKAQEDILRQRLFNSDNSVDAMALLAEVEEELDQSFRDQIFQSLKAGFLKVRTAVADRNN